MAHLNGVHHVAFMTADIKSQIAFFSDVLGLKLKALYWMHNVDGYLHAFMELNANSSVAFVAAPIVKDLPITKGVSHAGNPVKPCAAGVMQHIAFSVNSDEELLEMRDRIRSKGVRVLGPLEHGFCQSIYFGGPENLVLEVSTSPDAINGDEWIDPAVVKLNGISDEELLSYRNPAPYNNAYADAVAQPPSGIGKPEYSEMDKAFAAAFDLPDEVVLKELSESTPPVHI
ncbi:MAG: VOC family protein [Gammaproteobacteria bacterium]|jgi:catechol 2,3-dioxygenase-like lactoylglutathione lyase family enzyme|tara:strand:+ start:862 stop:1548 length:687 start_codon:yes stop_codon:yes gene_type:complete